MVYALRRYKFIELVNFVFLWLLQGRTLLCGEETGKEAGEGQASVQPSVVPATVQPKAVPVTSQSSVTAQQVAKPAAVSSKSASGKKGTGGKAANATASTGQASNVSASVKGGPASTSTVSTAVQPFLKYWTSVRPSEHT